MGRGCIADVETWWQVADHRHTTTMYSFAPVGTLKVSRRTRTTYTVQVVWKVGLVSPSHTSMITLVFFLLASCLLGEKRLSFHNKTTPKYICVKKIIVAWMQYGGMDHKQVEGKTMRAIIYLELE
jgi:hypothetical protein